MTRDDIIRMAREADPFGENGRLYQMAELAPETLERFAELVAAAERERFALECIDLVAFYGGPVDLEAAIRARGQA